MRNALITGGLGFVGSFIARQLLREGHVDQVVALDHFGRYVSSLRPGFVDHRSARLLGIQDQIIVERGEAKYASVMMHLIARYEPEYVFHLAALPLAKIGNLIAEEAQDGSIRSTANLVEAIAARQRETKYRVKRFVYASSSMVYGDFVSETATEDHPTKPKELYGTMKLAGEIVAFGLGQYYDVPVSAVRPSAVYGPTDMNRRVSQIFIERAMAGESLNFMGADEPLDFTYVTDTANGFVLAGTKEAAVGEVFNITHGKAHTLLEFVQCLQKRFPDLAYEVTEREAFRPRRGTLSIDKARHLLGYEPQVDLEVGIDACIRFMETGEIEGV